LEEALSLHRASSLRWDFVSSENSTGFHSPQEAARILGIAIDHARQAQLKAVQVQQQIANNGAPLAASE
jgi:nitrite reductase (cytochrome c-552)